ncbi:MAG: hypothetical protein PWP56_2057 [Acetobacterium sp.]|nr:hypothetical protein [Acetobacterium sp.]
MPFDNEQVLFDSLKSKLQSGDIIFIEIFTKVVYLLRKCNVIAHFKRRQ